MLAMNVQPTRASRQPAPSLTTIASKLAPTSTRVYSANLNIAATPIPL